MVRSKIVWTLATLALIVGLRDLGRATAPASSSNTWVPAGTLSGIRTDAAGALLPDGSVIVTGGADANAATASVDRFVPGTGVSAAPSMTTERAAHTATALGNGTVLVTGGVAIDGTVTASAEIFDGSSWRVLATPMNEPRAHHTATLLDDGRVLIAGGSTGSGVSNSTEIFDPSTEIFTLGPAMSSPRQAHAAALLADKRVLIAGGADDKGNPSATIDLFDVASGSLASSSMRSARSGLTATRLLDNRVLLAGGAGANGELGSTEIFDPSTDHTTAGGNLTQARRDHLAFLLPHNNAVLLVGGRTAGTAIASAELYFPWSDSAQATGAMAAAHAGAAGAALSTPGALLVAGGGTAAAEGYQFATVQTDADDYAPWTQVTITGSGWQPGETVTLTLLESPNLDTHATMTAVADANGNIRNTDFYPDDHDVNIRFYLTATGSASQAQTTFTDANPNSLTVTATTGSVAPGGTATYDVAILFGGNNNSCTVNLSIAPNPVTTGAAPSFSPASVSSTGATQHSTLTIPTTASGANRTLPGSYAFTVTGTPSGCQGGSNAVTGGGSLIVFGTADHVEFVQQPTSATAATTIAPAVTVRVVDTNGNTVVNSSAPVTVAIGSNPGGGTLSGTLTRAAVNGIATFNNLSIDKAGTGYRLTAGSSGLTGATSTTFNIAAASAAKIRVETAIDGSGTIVAAQNVNSGSSITVFAIARDANDNFVSNPQGANWSLTNITGGVVASDLAAGNGGRNATFTGHATGSAVIHVTATVAGNPLTPVDSGVITVPQTAVATTLASVSGTGTYGSTGTLTATLMKTSDSTPVANKTINFTVNGTSVGTAVTNASGVATLTGVAMTNGATRIAAGTHANFVGAGFAGDASFLTSSGSGSLTVAQATLHVTATGVNRAYDGSTSATVTLSDDRLSGDTFTTAYASATFADKNVGTGKTVTVTGISIAGVDAGNYSLASTTASTTANITTRPVTVTADPETKAYGDPDPGLTYTVTSGSLAAGDSFSGSLARIPGENVGSYAIQQGTLALSANYALTYAGANLTVTARPITVTADAQTKVYGDTDPALTYKITSGSLAFTDTFTGALTRAAGENVGTYAISQGTLTAGTNYNLTFVGANLTITARPITVTADAQTKVYGDTDPALTYKITSGSLAFSDAFTGALVRAAGESVAAYAINQGTLTAGTNYNLTFVGANLTITARPITVTADAQTKVYGDTDPSLTYKVTSGSLAFTDTFTGILARAAGESVAAYAINQGTLTAGANYNLTFVGANLTITARPITVTADAQTKVYGDTDPSLTYKVTSGSVVGTDSFTGSLARASGENVGSYAIQQGTLALSTNYILSYIGASLTITARPITVTADPQTKVYGDADPTLTYKVTSGSVVGSDSFTGSLARASGQNVGTYAINQGTLTLGNNYNLTYAGASLTITARPITITADAQTKVYGDTDPALTYKITAGSLVGADSFTGTLARASGENVGTYAITVGSVSAGTNYNLTFAGANLTITARPITITADAQTKVYGDTDPALTYKITAGSLVGADSFTGTLARASGENVGTYAITVGFVSAGTNYNLTYVGANLTITARPITVTADPQTKVYGDPDPTPLTYKITTGTLVTGDSFTGTLLRVAGETVGGYAIQQGTLALSANYNLTYVGANLTITARPITVTADPQTKVYGDPDPTPLTYKITTGTLVTGDSFTGTLLRVAGETVGGYAIQQGTLALNANYNLTYVGANLMITTRPVTVSADGKSKGYGDADPALTYQVTSGSLVNGDILSGALTRVAGENVGTYAIQQGSVALNTNYALTYIGANLTITARPITVTADAQSKVYGDADPTLTYHISSGSLAFSDVFTGALNRAPGETVGSYAIQRNTLTLSTNYTLTYIGANLTISARSITVTADSQTKVYGDADPALTYKVPAGSLVNGDTFTGALARIGGENVGSYAIQKGTLALNANYALTFAGASLTITPRPITVTANAQTKLYGSADPLFTYQVSGSLAFNDGFSGALTRAAGENVGSYAILQGTLALSTNYTVTFNTANLTITKATLTVTANSATATLNGVLPSLTVGYAGFKFSDTAAVLGGTLVFAPLNTSAVGTYSITPSGLTSPNYNIVFVSGTLTVSYATGAMCDGSAGHQILQPINVDNTSVFKQGSTVPAKFRVCDAKGVSIGTPGVVASFVLASRVNGTVSTQVNEAVDSTTPDPNFRWDPSAQQWIFNINTKGSNANATYNFLITLNDGTTIPFTFGLR